MIMNAFIADPQYKIDFEKFEIFSKKFTNENFINRVKGPILKIPTVFHVIHNFGGENLSDASIITALNNMNNHWRKRDSDTINIAAPFDLIHDDMEIEFVLAKKDPLGNCTNGITRHISELTYDAGDNVKDLTKAKLDWPSNEYLNIWVVASIASGAGGYSYFPGVSPSIDGIVVLRGQLSALAHEAGHWLSLAHLWGGTNDSNLSTNCTSDDGIDDTPNTRGQSFCSTLRNSCDDSSIPFLDIYGNEIWPAANGEIHDNVQNYMDYAFCGPENFTQGQKARTHATLNSNNGGRDNLITSTNADSTGIATTFNCGSIPIPDFDVSNEYGCTTRDLSMLDNTYNANDVNYLWDFEGNATASSLTADEPAVSWPETGRYDITLTTSNSFGSNSLTKTKIAKILNGEPIEPFTESFLAPNFPMNDINDSKKTWFIDGVSNPNSFIRTNVASSEGPSSLMLDIKETHGVHRLISPMIDVTKANCSQITFDLAYAARTDAAIEKFIVKASTNCGSTWPSSNIIYEVSRQNIAPYESVINGPYIPSANDWLSHSVDMGKFIGEKDVLIMFEFQTNSGNTLYIDNINFGCRTEILHSISDLNKMSFQIYPNPTNKDATIDLSLLKENVSIQIMDVAGKVLAVKKVLGNKRQLDISEIAGGFLENGVYLISVKNDNFNKTQKLIIH